MDFAFRTFTDIQPTPGPLMHAPSLVNALALSMKANQGEVDGARLHVTYDQTTYELPATTALTRIFFKLGYSFIEIYGKEGNKEALEVACLRRLKIEMGTATIDEIAAHADSAAHFPIGIEKISAHTQVFEVFSHLVLVHPEDRASPVLRLIRCASLLEAYAANAARAPRFHPLRLALHDHLREEFGALHPDILREPAQLTA